MDNRDLSKNACEFRALNKNHFMNVQKVAKFRFENNLNKMLKFRGKLNIFAKVTTLHKESQQKHLLK